MSLTEINNHPENGNNGEVVFTKSLLLAHKYEDKGKKNVSDPTGWWCSEKFDGYRAVWNGKEFVSRTGNKYNTPEWFSSIMPPNIALDGELWIGREKKDFENCGVIRHKTITEEIDKQWKDRNIKFKVFDMPASTDAFEGRMKEIANIVKQRAKYVKAFQLPYYPLEATKQTKIKDDAHLQKMFINIVKKGGEGLMLRKPNSKYEHKRSRTLLKMKPVHDAEAVIIGYKLGAGKYKGMLGSFQCHLQKNPKIKFYISGMDDAIRKSYKTTHPIGTVITFQYNETTSKGVPRFARYIRIRNDV
jgi:DNA ligase 1